MIPDKEFNVMFDLVYDHHGGDVLVQTIDKKSMRWGIRKGSAYPGEVHSHGHLLAIEQGTGYFQCGREKIRYKPGDLFDVPKGLEHAFIQVDEATLVHQRNY